MKIPRDQNLHSQSFLSDKLEFVWVFQEKTGILKFVFGVQKNGLCYIEFAKIDSVGCYIDDQIFFMSDIEINTLDSKLIFPYGKFPEEYNNFQNGKELIQLAVESLEYMKRC